MLQLTDSNSLFSPKYDWEVEKCIDNIFSKKLSNLTITLTEFDTFEESQHTLLNCMGESIKLDKRLVLQDPAKWALGKLSEGLYKHKLGHCESDCMCKHPEVGKWPHLGYWMQFNIINIEGYRELGLAVKQQYLDSLSGNILEVKPEVTIVREYLEDQLLVDFAYWITNGYKAKSFALSDKEFRELLLIAKTRREKGQPITEKLLEFVFGNIGVNKRQGGGNKGKRLEELNRGYQPSIGDGDIDYRIMYMIKCKAEEGGLDYKKLIGKNARGFAGIIQEVCGEIVKWDYFSAVTPSGKPKVSTISSVRERYFAKHPV